MRSLPPSDTGTFQLTSAVVSPAMAVTLVGASGTPTGVTGDDATDAGPVPIAFVAVTVNVWAVPLVKSMTVQLVAPLVEHRDPPGDAVTV